MDGFGGAGAHDITVPRAGLRRWPIVLACALACAALAVLVGQRGATSHVASSTIVLNDPQSQTANPLFPVAPELYVNGQIALFGLEELRTLAAELATDSIRDDRRLSVAAETTVGTDVSVDVDGTVVIGEPARIVVGANGAISVPAVPTAAELSETGVVRTAAAGAALDSQRGPFQVGNGDQTIIRSDGLLVTNPATGAVAAISPAGQPISAGDPAETLTIVGAEETDESEDAASETTVAPSPATELGFTRSADGQYSVAAADRTVEFSADGRAVVLEPSGELIRRPDSGAAVGPDAETVLVDGARVIAISETEIVAIEPDGAVVVLTRGGELVAATENAPVEAADISYNDLVPFTADEIEAGLTTTAVPDSFVIDVKFRSAEPERAIAGANAAVDAYQNLQEQSATGQNAQALARADQTLARLTDDLVVAEAQLTQLRQDAGFATQVEDQYDQVLAEIAATGEALLREAASEEAVQGNRLRDLLTQLNAIETVSRLELAQPEIAEAVAERDQVRQRLAELQIERDALVVATAAAPRTVAIESPALDAEEAAGLGIPSLVVVGVILGTLVGVILAYLIEVRSPRRLQSPLEAEQLLGTPLMAEIPDYRHESIKGILPVLSEPDSHVAEAYRISAAALSIAARTKKTKLIGFVSATAGAGKTSVVSNLAVALGQGNRKVLVLDSDLEGRALGGILRQQAGRAELEAPGIANILRSELAFADTIDRLHIGAGIELDVITAGTQTNSARLAVGAELWTRLFSEARRSNYDLVLVDVAPLLSVAYASRVLQELQGV
ncbi:MAG: AAA family ATPase, partial [Actinomycetota bacterium]